MKGWLAERERRSGLNPRRVGWVVVAAAAAAVLALVAVSAGATASEAGARPDVRTAASAGDVAAISTGGEWSCALTREGGVKCWGQQGSGEVGNGSTIGGHVLAPVDVVGLTRGVKAIGSGQYSSCALLVNGTVRCWGLNDRGSLGNGSKQRASGVPVVVRGLRGAKALAVGGGNACVITATGSVKCWGDADGNGSTKDAHVPISVRGLPSAAKVLAVGGYGACAVLVKGGVWCWGLVLLGHFRKPTPVSGWGSDVRSLNMFCAVTGSGALSCLDRQHDGASHLSTHFVSDYGSGLKAVSTGIGDAFCVVTASNGLKCSGDDLSGALGSGQYGTTGEGVVDVVGLQSAVKAVAVGSDFTCALLESARMKCWGSNQYGQLGIGRPVPSPGFTYRTPQDVVPWQSLTLRSSRPAGSIAQGTAVTFTGKVSPPGPATVRFEVSRRVGGKWQLVSRHDVTANAAGGATYSFSFPATGVWSVRAMALANAATASAWSARIVYRVS